MRCLWLSGDVPAPPSTGLLAYSLGLSEALAGTGAEVVGLGLARDERLPTAVHWRPIGTRRAPAARSLVTRYPSMVSSLDVAPYRAAVASTLVEGRWDAVVVDHLQMGWALDRLVRAGRPAPIVYISHNHEASTRLAAAREEPWRSPRKVPLLLDGVKAARLERRLVAGVDLLTTITDTDEAGFAPVRSGRPVVTLTPGYDGPVVAERTITAATPRQVVLVANLVWHVKQTNLLRFLDVADPAFARAGIELVVAGSVPADFLERVDGRFAATRFTGRFATVDDVLADARVGIVSEPLGGGFKLKSLDYVFNRVPMAVLEGSIAGLPLTAGVDHLSLPDEAALADAVVAVIDDLDRLNTMQRNAFSACATHFAWPRRGADLRAALEGLGR